jgi:hypothetical protein
LFSKQRFSYVIQVTDGLNERPISLSRMSKLHKRKFKKYIIKGMGDSFAQCGICDELKRLHAVQPPGTKDYNKIQLHFDKHIHAHGCVRNVYCVSHRISKARPKQALFFIHEKMDHSKTWSPCFTIKHKGINGLVILPISVIGMLAHGHGDVKYAHYSLDLYPIDDNHMIGSIAKLLHDLEEPPIHSWIRTIVL